MDNKKFNILLILGGILVLVGVSYAYFAATVTGNESTSTISYEAGYLEIELNGGPNITANRIIPKDTPFATKTITLTGKNNSNGNMPYNIEIVVDNNTYTNNSISYSIEGTNTSNSGVLIPNMEYIPINDTTIIGSGLFERGNNQVHTYTIKFYFLDNNTDQSANMRANFSAHIKINGEEAEKPAPKNWWKANSTTLLGAIRDNSVVHKDTDEGMTTPGQQIATKDEGLRMTLDDYGVSYYFRGAVENNYIKFAGLCWRIVRIDGKGNVKLSLYNNNSESCTTTGENDAFSHLDVKFNNNHTRNGYVGYMYGTNLGSSYDDEHANNNESNILKKLKEWYDSKINISISEQSNKKYSNYLADVVWCNDKSLNSGDGFTSGSGSVNYYSSYNRIIPVNTANPIFMCPNSSTKLNLAKYKNISRFTAGTTVDSNGNGALHIYNAEKGEYVDYKIGLLTVDEVAYAGTIRGGENMDYYLNKNAYGTSSWTLSPYNLNGNSARVFTTCAGGISKDNFLVSYNNSVRPSIALIPTVTATYNKNDTINVPGSAANPYVVSVS